MTKRKKPEDFLRLGRPTLGGCTAKNLYRSRVINVFASTRAGARMMGFGKIIQCFNRNRHGSKTPIVCHENPALL
jgi:hypothetical protein